MIIRANKNIEILKKKNHEKNYEKNQEKKSRKKIRKKIRKKKYEKKIRKLLRKKAGKSHEENPGIIFFFFNFSEKLKIFSDF